MTTLTQFCPFSNYHLPLHDIKIFFTLSFLKELGSERACQLKNLDDFATSQTIPLCKN